LNLPHQFIPGLRKLALLDEKGFQEISAGLQQIPPKMYRKDISSKLSRLVTAVTAQDTKELTYAIFGLNIGLAASEDTIDEFVSGALQDVEESEDDLTEDQIKVLETRLRALLQINNLRVGAKAQSVFFENERSLAEVRVLTDLRPVYVGKPSEAPAAAILVHNLKVGYLEKGQLKDFYVALDAKDLQKVIDALERAKEKQKSLIKGIGTSSFPVIEPD
jgi:hypothetical protein